MQPKQTIIILLRHAHASWPRPGEKDFDRTLDVRGRAEAKEMAARLQSMDIRPERIICSPATRCRETLAAFAETWPSGTRIEFNGDLYDGGLPTYADLVSAHHAGGALMIVGHNPMIEDVFTFMAHGQQEDFVGYGTATLAILSRKDDVKDENNWKVEAFCQPSAAL